MIDLNDYVTQCELLQRGESNRVNHQDCPAGTDTRRRLYLTRPAGSPEIILGYCHNCQDKGILKSNNPHCYRSHDAAIEAGQNLSTDKWSPPHNLVTKCHEWPADAISWRYKMSLHIAMIDALGIAYDPSTHRIYLPMWRTIKLNGPKTECSNLIGYQLRRLSDRGSKYITALQDKGSYPSTLIYPLLKAVDSREPPVSILVEDFASGIALAETAYENQHQWEVIVNYGTKVTPEVLARCDQWPALVWLDNDSLHVSEQAEHIGRVWAMITGNDVHIERDAREPKKLTATEIQRVVERHVG